MKKQELEEEIRLLKLKISGLEFALNYQIELLMQEREWRRKTEEALEKVTRLYNAHIEDLEETDGCSDGGCILRDNKGQVTNGGCSCLKEINHISHKRKVANAQDALRQVREDGIPD